MALISTSNSWSYTESTQTIISDSMSFIGKLGDGDVLSDSDYNLCLRTLNRMTKSIMVKNGGGSGMKMWQRSIGYLFLSGDTGTYSVSAVPSAAFSGKGFFTNSFLTTSANGTNSPGSYVINVANSAGINADDVFGVQLDSQEMIWANVESVGSNTVTLDVPLPSGANGGGVVYDFTSFAQPPQVVDWVNLRNSNGNDVYVNILTYEEYNALAGKANPGFTGDPAAIYYESHLTGSAPYCYINTDVNGAVDLTKYLVINYVRELQDWVNLSDQPDFPKEWYSALVYNLAKNIAPYFKAVWSPLQEELATSTWKMASRANPAKSSAKFSRSRNSSTYNNPPHR